MTANEEKDIIAQFGPFFVEPIESAKLQALFSAMRDRVAELKRKDPRGFARGRYVKSAKDKLLQGIMHIICSYGYQRDPQFMSRFPRCYALVRNHGVEAIAEVLAPVFWERNGQFE